MDILTKRIRNIMKAAFISGFEFYNDEYCLVGRNHRNDMIVVMDGRMIIFRSVTELNGVR